MEDISIGQDRPSYPSAASKGQDQIKEQPVPSESVPDMQDREDINPAVATLASAIENWQSEGEPSKEFLRSEWPETSNIPGTFAGEGEGGIKRDQDKGLPFRQEYDPTPRHIYVSEEDKEGGKEDTSIPSESDVQQQGQFGEAEGSKEPLPEEGQFEQLGQPKEEILEQPPKEGFEDQSKLLGEGFEQQRFGKGMEQQAEPIGNAFGDQSKPLGETVEQERFGKGLEQQDQLIGNEFGDQSKPLGETVEQERFGKDLEQQDQPFGKEVGDQSKPLGEGFEQQRFGKGLEQDQQFGKGFEQQRGFDQPTKLVEGSQPTGTKFGGLLGSEFDQSKEQKDTDDKSADVSKQPPPYQQRGVEEGAQPSFAGIQQAGGEDVQPAHRL